MIKTDITVGINYTVDDIKAALCRTLPISTEEIRSVEICKKTLKLGDGSPSFRLSVAAQLSPEREAGLLKMKKKVSPYERPEFSVRKYKGGARPVVVGAGPAGLFAALVLAESGARPIILERGEAVEEREKRVKGFFLSGILSEESNVQFGEGGAGAFSDGKLKVGSMDKYKYKLLSEFVEAGAPPEILYTVGAHLGTDKLPQLVKSIREKAKSLGAEFIYGARLVQIQTKDGCVCYAVYKKGGKEEKIPTDKIILAAGHSAADVFSMLYSMNVPMVAKGFGIGMRVEHKREHIDKLIYGASEYSGILGAASYHLVTHLKSGRSVYSFCMCPGGVVVPAASEGGGVVTNGMSEYARDGENSNSALLVSMTPEDFGSDSPLAGIAYQRKIERLAYLSGGGSYKAPFIGMREFLKGESPVTGGSVTPSYLCGVTATAAEDYLPECVTQSLRQGICDFDDWIPGFITDNATLTGAETRSTSPVRVLRGENYQALNVKGLYPVGEGAGYAGGIVSSGVDGIRCAEAIVCEGGI